MFIKEFYSKFTSRQERSNVFDAMRRLSSLERPALSVEDDEWMGWPEWPCTVPGDARMQEA